MTWYNNRNKYEKFQDNGVLRQETARNANGAKWCFGYSCNICCNKGLHLECEECRILEAHKEALERFGEEYIEEN